MPVKINCKYNDQGAWCKNSSIKRSLWGFGARCCVLYPPDQKSSCEFREEKFKKPKLVR